MTKRYCSQCGNALDINDKFCPSCGSKTETVKHKASSRINKKVIVGAILSIIVIIFIVNMVMPLMSSNVPLEEKSFKFLTISVPSGSDFSIEVNMGDKLLMTNTGSYEGEASAIFTKFNSDENDTGVYKLQNTTQDLKIYKGPKDYRVDKEMGNYKVMIQGNNLDLIIKMINTAKIDETIAP